MSRAEVPDPYVRHGSLRMGDRTKGIVEAIWRNLTLRNLTGLKDNGTRRNLGKPNLALRKNCSIEFAAGIQDFQRLPVSFQLGEPASSFSHQAEKDAKEFRTWGFYYELSTTRLCRRARSAVRAPNMDGGLISTRRSTVSERAMPTRREGRKRRVVVRHLLDPTQYLQGMTAMIEDAWPKYLMNNAIHHIRSFHTTLPVLHASL